MKLHTKYLALIMGITMAFGCSRQHRGPDDFVSQIEKNKEVCHYPFSHYSRFSGLESTRPALKENNQAEYYLPSYKPEKNQRYGTIPTMIVKEQDLNYREYRCQVDSLIPGIIIPFERIAVPDNRFLVVEFDNDIFDNTDYYFTNGINIEFYHPFFEVWPFSRILLPGIQGSTDYYGLVITQNIYTPIEIEREDVQYGDRPFCSYMYLGHKKVSLEPSRKIRLTSEIDIGVMGPAALGAFVQGSIHNYEPVGWKNQVQDDMVLNYTVVMEKGLVSGHWFKGGIKGSVQAGTLYDNLAGGIFLQAGKTDGRFGTLFINTPSGQSLGKRIRYYLSFDINAKLVGYNATLQGGLFNKTGSYSLQSGEVCRYVLEGGAGLGLGLGNFSLEARQVYLSPEFKGGKPHLWMGIKTIFSL